MLPRAGLCPSPTPVPCALWLSLKRLPSCALPVWSSSRKAGAASSLAVVAAPVLWQMLPVSEGWKEFCPESLPKSLAMAEDFCGLSGCILPLKWGWFPSSMQLALQVLSLLYDGADR